MPFGGLYRLAPAVVGHAENLEGRVLGVLHHLVPGVGGEAALRAHDEGVAVLAAALDLQLDFPPLDERARVGWLGHLPGVAVAADQDFGVGFEGGAHDAILADEGRGGLSQIRRRPRTNPAIPPTITPSGPDTKAPVM